MYCCHMVVKSVDKVSASPFSVWELLLDEGSRDFAFHALLENNSAILDLSFSPHSETCLYL